MTSQPATRPAAVVGGSNQKRSAKPQWKPSIHKESADTYTINSQTYTYVLYTVTVAEGRAVTCDCTAGQYGNACKHRRLVQGVVDYHKNPSHLRPVDIGYGKRAPMASPALVNPWSGNPAGLDELFMPSGNLPRRTVA